MREGGGHEEGVWMRGSRRAMRRACGGSVCEKGG